MAMLLPVNRDNIHCWKRITVWKFFLLAFNILLFMLFVIPGVLYALDAPFNAEHVDEDDVTDSGVVFGDRENPGSSYFPLLKHLVPKNQWDQLPRPYGIAYVFHTQSQWYRITEVTLGGVDVPPEILEPVAVNAVSYSHSLKADLWLFPFLNVYMLGAYTTGDANVFVNFENQPQPVQLIFDFTAYSIGPGATLALGYGNFFMTATYVYTFIFRPNSDSSNGNAFTALFGYNFPLFNIWIGPQYQSIDRTQGGYMGDIRYDVTIDPESEWNMQVGFRFSLIKQRLDLIYQQGIGQRLSSTLNLSWRMGE